MAKLINAFNFYALLMCYLELVDRSAKMVANHQFCLLFSNVKHVQNDNLMQFFKTHNIVNNVKERKSKFI